MTTTSIITEQNAYKILIVIDTATIKKKHFNDDSDTKEPLKIEKANWFAICQTKETNNSADEVYIDRKKYNKIIISGISIDGNSSDAIILNQIKNHKSGKKTILKFEAVCMSKKTISNDQNNPDELAVLKAEQNFIWFESLIYNLRNSKIKIQFSQYYLNSDGNQQDFYGSFWFPLEINLYLGND